MKGRMSGGECGRLVKLVQKAQLQFAQNFSLTVWARAAQNHTHANKPQVSWPDTPPLVLGHWKLETQLSLPVSGQFHTQVQSVRSVLVHHRCTEMQENVKHEPHSCPDAESFKDEIGEFKSGVMLI